MLPLDVHFLFLTEVQGILLLSKHKVQIDINIDYLLNRSFTATIFFPSILIVWLPSRT